MITLRSRLLAALLAGTLAFAFAAAGFAEPAARRPAEAAKEATEAARLPADVTTEQTVELPDRTLRFTATAGSIPINNGEGRLQAEIAYIAYLRPDTEAAGRPLTFVFNGGPGASSAHMQLGAPGPRRPPPGNITPPSTPARIPKPHTPLHFTHPGFVHPVGTRHNPLLAARRR